MSKRSQNEAPERLWPDICRSVPSLIALALAGTGLPRYLTSGGLSMRSVESRTNSELSESHQDHCHER